MKPQQQRSPFGEKMGFIPMGDRGLMVCRALRSSDRFNLLWCPGPIVELMLDAWQTACTLVVSVAKEGERRGLDVRTRVCRRDVWMAFSAREITFALLQDRTWLIHVSEAGTVFVEECGFERMLAVIAQEARGVFMPGYERAIEEARGAQAHTV